MYLVFIYGFWLIAFPKPLEFPKWRVIKVAFVINEATSESSQGWGLVASGTAKSLEGWNFQSQSLTPREGRGAGD